MLSFIEYSRAEEDDESVRPQYDLIDLIDLLTKAIWSYSQGKNMPVPESKEQVQIGVETVLEMHKQYADKQQKASFFDKTPARSKSFENAVEALSVMRELLVSSTVGEFRVRLAGAEKAVHLFLSGTGGNTPRSMKTFFIDQFEVDFPKSKKTRSQQLLGLFQAAAAHEKSKIERGCDRTVFIERFSSPVQRQHNKVC